MSKNIKYPNEKTVYLICIEDIQNVAKKSFSRKLKEEELKIIEEKIGDCFDWYDSIESCISIFLNLPHKYSDEED